MSTKHSDMKIEKINDQRIASYVNRIRSGSTQVFYTGDDSRDWDRYKAEGGGSIRGVEMHEKPDTIRIEPPEEHWYAELIDGEWWWLNGCAECNGRERDWITYIECEKHNVCRTCKTPRSELTEAPWGGKHGWQCKPCADAEHETEKTEALAAMPEEYDEWDYFHEDSVKCPYCNLEFEDSGDGELYQEGTQDKTCPRCDNTFEVETGISFHYTMKRKEDAA